MRSFSSFLTRKDRQNKEHLLTLFHVFKKAGFQIDNHLDDIKEPYLFIRKPVSIDPILEQLSFGGIRIYTRGSDIVCYRSQNKEQTEPFGTTYQLDISGMFKDLVRETNKDLLGHQIIFYIIKEVKDFFIRSAQAEKEEDTGGDSQMGAVIAGSMGTDYSNQVTDIKRN
jgi:hypothetical protein